MKVRGMQLGESGEFEQLPFINLHGFLLFFPSQ